MVLISWYIYDGLEFVGLKSFLSYCIKVLYFRYYEMLESYPGPLGHVDEATTQKLIQHGLAFKEFKNEP